MACESTRGNRRIYFKVVVTFCMKFADVFSKYKSLPSFHSLHSDCGFYLGSFIVFNHTHTHTKKIPNINVQKQICFERNKYLRRFHTKVKIQKPVFNYSIGESHVYLFVLLLIGKCIKRTLMPYVRNAKSPFPILVHHVLNKHMSFMSLCLQASHWLTD